MRSTIFIGLFALVSALPAGAQEVSLSEVRALALEKSPLVQALDSEYAAKLSEAVELSLPANPELDGSVNFPVDWKESRGDNELDLALSQPLRLSNFGTRSAVADLMKRSASAEQKAAVFKLLKEVDLAYVRLWALERQQQFLETSHHAALLRSKAIADGISRGVYSEGDRTLFAGGAARLEAELLGVEGDIKAAQSKLTSLTGVGFSARTLANPGLTGRLRADEVQAKEKTNAIGATQRASLLSELAAAQSRLAKKDAFPEFTPQLLLSRSDDGTTFVGAGLTLPLPLFNRNQAQISQREAELRAAQARREYVEQGNFADELTSMVDAVNLSMGEAGVFDEKVIPAFRESLNFQEKQFSAGTGSIVQIWQAQRELYEAQSSSLELWIKALSLRIELEIIIGQEL